MRKRTPVEDLEKAVSLLIDLAPLPVPGAVRQAEFNARIARAVNPAERPTEQPARKG